MATLKTRLAKLECKHPIVKQNIIIYPGQTQESVMKEKGISADELGNVWVISFVRPGDIPGTVWNKPDSRIETE